jgi:hypothetical protein
MVQGPDVASGTLLTHVEADPGIRIVKRISPDTVVLAMSAERAQRLRADFTREIVEVDADVDLFR